MSKKNYFFDRGDSFTLGLILGTISTIGVAYYTTNSFHTTEDVQPGYVATSKLEISLQEQDQDGLGKTILTYEGKDYLLKLDNNGMPTIQPYVKPLKAEADYK